MKNELPIEVRASKEHRLGMPVAKFLKHYWQKQPLLIRNAFEDFEAPITPNDLAGLAMEPLALARIVRQDVKKDRWHLETGPFTEQRFKKLPKTNWTLLVQDVDKWDADIAGLLRHFRFLPSWRIDDIMISYAVEGGSVGAHVDHYDVFLLQGLGQRRWQIDVDPNADLDCRADVELKLLKEFWPTHEWVLAPGDMLYLPPNVPHHGVALDDCMTISVGMRAPAVAEMIGDLADSLGEHLDEQQRYVDPDLGESSDPHQIDARSLKRIRSALKPLLELDDAALMQWFGRFITRYRSAQEPIGPARPWTASSLGKKLAAGQRVVRHPFARLASLKGKRGMTLFLAGQSIETSAGLYAAITAIDGLGNETYQRLPDDERALLLSLLNQGLLAVTR